MTPENPVDLNKRFANFKKNLIKGVKRWEIENFDEKDFFEFITGFYFPLLFEMAKFWSLTKEIKPAQFFNCCYACLDSTLKLITENGNLKECIDKEVFQDKY